MEQETIKQKWIKDHFICDPCAIKNGAKDTGENVNAKIGTCNYCKTTNSVLMAWVDYDYPNDPVLDRHAKRCRD